MLVGLSVQERITKKIDTVMHLLSNCRTVRTSGDGVGKSPGLFKRIKGFAVPDPERRTTHVPLQKKEIY